MRGPLSPHRPIAANQPITYFTDETTGKRKRTTKWHSLKLKGKKNRRRAEDALRDLELVISARAMPASGAMTVQDYVAEFLEDIKYSIRPKTLLVYRSSLGQFVARFAQHRLCDLTPRDVEVWKAELSTRYNPNSVDIALRCLRSALNVAIKKGLLDRSPMLAVRFAQVPKRTFPPFITITQFKSVVLEVVTDQRHRVASSLGMFAGLRLQEVSHLWWDQIDFERGLIRIESREDFQTKSGNGRTLPFYTTLREELPKLPCRGDYVLRANFFVPCGSALTHAWTHYRPKFVAADPTFPPITFHGLRHSLATWLARDAGINLRVLQSLLGHAAISTSMIYAHVQPQMAVEAAKKIDV